MPVKLLLGLQMEMQLGMTADMVTILPNLLLNHTPACDHLYFSHRVLVIVLLSAWSRLPESASLVVNLTHSGISLKWGSKCTWNEVGWELALVSSGGLAHRHLGNARWPADPLWSLACAYTHVTYVWYVCRMFQRLSHGTLKNWTSITHHQSMIHQVFSPWSTIFAFFHYHRFLIFYFTTTKDYCCSAVYQQLLIHWTSIAYKFTTR